MFWYDAFGARGNWRRKMRCGRSCCKSRSRLVRCTREAMLCIACATALSAASLCRAQTHPGGVPALSSRPGAGYTLYLDFAGFNFTGNWGAIPSNPGGSGTPGDTPAYSIDGNASFFTNVEAFYMKL